MRVDYLLRLRVLFGAIIVMLLVATGVTYWFGGPVLSANAQIIQQQKLIAELEETLSHLKDADNWEDGYVVTGDEKFLQPFDAAVAAMRGHLNTLRSEVQAGLRNAENIERLASLIDGKLAEMNRTMALRRQSGLEPA